MKLKDLISNVDKSTKNESWVSGNDGDILQSLEIQPSYDTEENTRLKAYYLFKWCCTDSYVGYRAYFLDDILVSVSTQLGRKCDETFEWVSAEAWTDTRNYINSLQTIPTPPSDILDLEEELPEYGMSIEFSEQLLSDTVYLKDTKELVKVTKKWYGYDPNTWKKVEVEMPNGEKKVVEMSDVIVPYCLKTI